MLKHAAGMVAAALAFRGLQVAWKQATGWEPPLGPDDQQAPLGRAVAWTLVMGAAVATARMIAIRYASKLVPGGQRQVMTETAAATFADYPDRSKGLSLGYQVPAVSCFNNARPGTGGDEVREHVRHTSTGASGLPKELGMSDQDQTGLGWTVVLGRRRTVRRHRWEAALWQLQPGTRTPSTRRRCSAGT